MNLVENEKHQARQSSNSPRHAPCHRRVKETNARFFDVRAQPGRLPRRMQETQILFSALWNELLLINMYALVK